MTRSARRQRWLARAGCVLALLCAPAARTTLIAPAMRPPVSPPLPQKFPRILFPPRPHASRAVRVRPHLHARSFTSIAPPPSIVQPAEIVASVESTSDAEQPASAHALRMPASLPPIDAPIVLRLMRPPLRAPRVLVPLYVSFGTLQALDYHSTRRALASGAGREANPLARGIVKSGPRLVAAKAAATAGVVLAGEKMWKRNRVGAVLFVAGVNVAMGVVVAHNYTSIEHH